MENIDNKGKWLKDTHLILLLVLPYCKLKTVLKLCEIIDVPDNIMRRFTRKSYAEFFRMYFYEYSKKNKYPCNLCTLPTNGKYDYECWECEDIYCAPCFKKIGSSLKFVGRGGLKSRYLCNECKMGLIICKHCKNHVYPKEKNFNLCSGCNIQMCSYCCYQKDENRKWANECAVCAKTFCPDCFKSYNLKCPSWIIEEKRPPYYSDNFRVSICSECFKNNTLSNC